MIAATGRNVTDFVQLGYAYCEFVNDNHVEKDYLHKIQELHSNYVASQFTHQFKNMNDFSHTSSLLF